MITLHSRPNNIRKGSTGQKQLQRRGSTTWWQRAVSSSSAQTAQGLKTQLADSTSKLLVSSSENIISCAKVSIRANNSFIAVSLL